MDLLADDELLGLLDSPTESFCVIDAKEYALLEQLEGQAQGCKPHNNVEERDQVQTDFSDTTIEKPQQEEKQDRQNEDITEQSISSEVIDEDLLVLALDSVEKDFCGKAVGTIADSVKKHTYRTDTSFDNEYGTMPEVDSKNATFREFECEPADAVFRENGAQQVAVDLTEKQENPDEFISLHLSNKDSSTSSSFSQTKLSSPPVRMVQRTLDGSDNCLWFPSRSSKKTARYVSMDTEKAQSWIFPTNVPEREYQFNIVRTALACNTFVCLPTGLGKTFIAAVVMYNFLRWYTEGKVVFMAPTKPLVRQQIAACYKIVGIPIEKTAEMTGSIKALVRKEMWNSKRAFFLTPQIMKNDIDNRICPASKVVCVVLDEAHRAVGKYVYCSIIDQLTKATEESFRVVALSATPGNSLSVIQDVINNLHIAKIEFRSEEDPDTKPYTFHRQIESVVVQLSSELNQARSLAMELLTPFLSNLCNYGAFYERSPERVSVMKLLAAKEKFKQNFQSQTNDDSKKRSFIFAQFSSAISLCYGINLLYSHGLVPFDSFLHSLEADTNQKNGGLRKFITCRETFKSLRTVTSSLIEKGIMHPKAIKCVEILRKHFENISVGCESNGRVSSRVIIFAQYRESVAELKKILTQHEPVIRAMCFVGQAPSATSGRPGNSAASGMTQKEQIQVLRDFRNGNFNVLVSTSIGEEGLDIADVDLIISYDVVTSPIRMLQRMGRTGRAREGRIVVLVTEGTEETKLNEMNRRASSISRMLRERISHFSFFSDSPRMLPSLNSPIVCERQELSIEHIQFSGENSVFPLGRNRNSQNRSEPGNIFRSDAFIANSCAIERMFLESYGLVTSLPTKLRSKEDLKAYIRLHLPKAVFGYYSSLSSVGGLMVRSRDMFDQISKGNIDMKEVEFTQSSIDEPILSDNSITKLSSSNTTSSYRLEDKFPGLQSVTDKQGDVASQQNGIKLSDNDAINWDVSYEAMVENSESEVLGEILSPPQPAEDVSSQDTMNETISRWSGQEKDKTMESRPSPVYETEATRCSRWSAKQEMIDNAEEQLSDSTVSTPILRVRARKKRPEYVMDLLSPKEAKSKRIRAPRNLRFIQSQASVSEEEAVEEEDEEQLGSLADFLVDDEEPVEEEYVTESQTSREGNETVNMHSIYLRSLLSPENKKLGFISPPRFGKPTNKGATKMGRSTTKY
eukprot:jgi/Galph1/4967/GphlegSOOS_G3661.1